MSKRRKAGSSAFGLALLAMLLFGAFIASAAQASTWHIDGQSFSGEESVSWSGGPITFTNSGWNTTITCGTVSGTTKILKSSQSSGTMTLGKCAVQNTPQCTVQPLNLNFSGYLVDSGGQAYERYNVSGKWTITGAQCTLTGQPEVLGSIAAAVGVPDAVHSPRVFSAAAESATGASGLQFISTNPWKATGEATASLAGKNAGKDFGTGVGGTWKPEAPATWTIGGKAFGGSEEVAFEGSGSVSLERATGGLTMECAPLASFWAEISGGDESAASALLYNCKIPQAPKCVVSNPELIMEGQIGFTEGYVLEKADLSGSWSMSGTGCPFTGAKAISGSLGAAIFPEGLSNHKVFGEIVDPVVKATGLRVNGETWSLNAEVDTLLNGANVGQEFGVE